MGTLKTRLFPNDPSAEYCYYSVIDRWVTDRARLLDVGCGDNTALARYRLPGREVWGADLVRHPRLQYPEWFRPMTRNGRLPFPNDAFDIVTSRWVLEHVALPQAFLSEISRVLRPGGIFVSLSINAYHYVTWLARVARLLPHRMTQEIVWRLYRRAHHDTFPVFYRLNDRRSLARWAGRSGMRLAELHYIANPDYFRFSSHLHNLATWVDWWLERLRPGLGRLYFVAVLSKNEDGRSGVA